MAFDGIVTKAIASELQQLSGARVDKIFQPNSNNVIIFFICKPVKCFRNTIQKLGAICGLGLGCVVR